jgi:hypothetical protein
VIGPALMVAALALAGAVCGFVKWDEHHGFPSLDWKYEGLVFPVVFMLLGWALVMYVLGSILWLVA